MNANQPKPRGLFLNTTEAQCSIYESGRMAYECLRLSERYQLDYHAFGPDSARIGLYDFYLLNYHHITMSWLNTDSIRDLPGKKFTLVLETLPGDPFVLCPSDVFDAYLALDPTMERPGDSRVYPFPRPLEAPLLLPPFQDPDVPIIGTFGFATPGKGFERVVDAVNREFQRAIVRINIPAATYADGVTCDLHKGNYASYLADLCRRVANPGIEVQVSNDFLSKQQLIRWCAGNSLNCFLYHRDQPGLAATTDQAIASGRPLAVSANETFRHLHRYLRPYPFQSLQDSLKGSLPAVQQMQKDWTPLAFARKFEGVLADFSLLADSKETSRQPGKDADRSPQKAKVLVVSHKESQCGIHQYGVNIVASLCKSDRFTFEHAPCSSPGELHRAILATEPKIVIYNYYSHTMPWLTPSVTRRYPMPCLGVMHEVTQGEADQATTELFDFHLCPDPTLLTGNPCVISTKRLIPHHLNQQPEPSNPVIGSFGFGFADKGFERLIHQVQEEYDAAVIRLHLPFNDIVDPQGAKHALATAERCRSAVYKPGIGLEIRHHFMGKQDLLDFLGANTVNAFLYDVHKVRGISSVIEYALAVERPLAISKCGMFRHIVKATPSICIEESSLRQIIANGIAPLVPFYNDWSEASFIRDYELILDRVLATQAAQPVEPQSPAGRAFNELQRLKAAETERSLSVRKIAPYRSVAHRGTHGSGYNRILDHQARRHYQPAINRLCRLDPETMARKIPEANVQQAFVISVVEEFAKAMNSPRILCVGSYEDTAASGLQALGYSVEGIDPAVNYDLNSFFHLPTTLKGNYDIIFSTSVIEHVEDDELFVRQIQELLAHGGAAIITCDYNDQYEEGGLKPPEDFRLYTKKDLAERLLQCMEDCSLVDEPAWECADPDFTYAGCRYTFATFVVRKNGNRGSAALDPNTDRAFFRHLPAVPPGNGI